MSKNNTTTISDNCDYFSIMTIDDIYGIVFVVNIFHMMTNKLDI